MATSTGKNIARWIFVLPAAIAGAVSAEVFLWLSEVIRAFPPTVLGELFFSGLGGFLFVVIGAWTAPDHERKVGLVLVIVLSVVAGFGSVGYIVTEQTWNLMHVIASVVGGGIGFLVGADHRAIRG